MKFSLNFLFSFQFDGEQKKKRKVITQLIFSHTFLWQFLLMKLLAGVKRNMKFLRKLRARWKGCKKSGREKSLNLNRNTYEVPFRTSITNENFQVEQHADEVKILCMSLCNSTNSFSLFREVIAGRKDSLRP